MLLPLHRRVVPGEKLHHLCCQERLKLPGAHNSYLLTADPVGVLLLAARWLVAGMFLRSGLAKAVGIAEFRSAVANYRLLPPELVTAVAVLLPFAEIGAAALLAAGVFTMVVGAALAVLLIGFALAIAINLARGRVFDCGCAGSEAVPRIISWWHVVTDLVLAAVAAVIAVASPGAAQLWRGPASPVHVTAPDGGAFPVLLAVIVCQVAMLVSRRAAAVRDLAAMVSRDLAANDSRRH